MADTMPPESGAFGTVIAAEIEHFENKSPGTKKTRLFRHTGALKNNKTITKQCNTVDSHLSGQTTYTESRLDGRQVTTYSEKMTTYSERIGVFSVWRVGWPLIVSGHLKVGSAQNLTISNGKGTATFKLVGCIVGCFFGTST